MLPTSAEIARIRADIQAYTFPDTCVVLSLSQVSDGQGGFTDTWGTAIASVVCRLDVNYSMGRGVYGEEKAQAASLKPYGRWILSAPHGTNITTANRIVCNSGTFNVVEVDSPQSWHGALRVTLEKV